MNAPNAFPAFLDSALQVRRGEGRRTALLFTHLLLASAVFFLGRTVRDTLFLSRYPLSALPWMFVIYGVVSAGVAAGYGRIADRLPRGRMIALSCALGAATYLAAWIGVRAQWRPVYPAFYVWTEVVSNLLIVQFWTLANDLHDARSAKRLFGTIGAARLLASVLVGLAAGAVVRAIGTAQLILVLIVLMGAIAAVAAVAAREAHAEAGQRAGRRPRRRGRAPGLLRDPYVRLLALVLVLAFTALNIGDYQFKAVARAAYQEDQLARFFALFYAATGAAAFLFQLVVTPRILARAGVAWGMAVMPGAFGLSSALLAFWPRLLAASLMKFSDNGFQFTIQESTFQALYVPFAPETKARTRAFLDAIVKPLGYAAAGLAVVAFGAAFTGAPQRFALLTLPLVAAWLALVPAVRRRYLRQLEGTLTARGALALDESPLLDSSGRDVLVNVLEHGTPPQILVALEQLREEPSAAVRRTAGALTAHADPLVREAALRFLEGDRSEDGPGHDAALAAARTALRDPEPAVRGAAVITCAALGGDDAVDDLAPLVDDPDPHVRANAVGALLRDGGVEGGIVGGAELGRLLASASRADVVTAARALRLLGPRAYRPLRRLLDVDDPVVRRAALKAASGVADPRLVPVLIGLLADPACRARAGQALVAVGPPAAPALAALLEDDAVPRDARLEVPRLLRRIPRPASYDLLRRHLAAPDSRLRLRLYSALSILRTELHRKPESLAFVASLARREIAEADRTAAAWAAARPQFDAPLLDELFRVRREHALRRVLRLLELRFDREALRLVREHLRDGTRRANALEVLDTLLDAPLRPLVMPFADEAAPPHAPPDLPRPSDLLAAHCRHPNPYVALLALDALARRADPVGAREGETLLAHEDPLVREGAVLAVAAAAPPAQARALLGPLADDPDRTVARLAARTLDRLAGRPVPEEPMYSTVEKILFLKNAAVFAGVNGEDLAPLARIAEGEVYAPGAMLVREGEPGDALYIIVHGAVAVEHAGRRLARLGPGDSVGEMAVLDNAPRSATARAEEETEVLRIGSEEFYEILHEHVEIAEGVIRVLSQRLRRLDEEMARRQAS